MHEVKDLIKAMLHHLSVRNSGLLLQRSARFVLHALVFGLEVKSRGEGGSNTRASEQEVISDLRHEGVLRLHEAHDQSEEMKSTKESMPSSVVAEEKPV